MEGYKTGRRSFRIIWVKNDASVGDKDEYKVFNTSVLEFGRSRFRWTLEWEKGESDASCVNNLST